jgi:flagellin
MAFSVNTNTEAMAALRMLNATNKSLATTQERINSGLKVGSARDNASTFAIAQAMRGDIASFKTVSDSLALGQATINVGLSAATSVSDTLNQIKAKVTAAQEGNVDRSKIQADIEALVNQVDTIIQSAEFNGVNLLKTASSDLEVMSGLDPANKITVAHQNLEGVHGSISGIDVDSQVVEMQFSSDAVFADNDTISLTTGDGTKTFEFIDDPSSTAPTNGDNIVVDYDPAASMGENLAQFISKAAENGIALEYNTNGNLVASASSGITAGSATLATGTMTATASGDDPATAMTTVDNAISSVTDMLASLGTDANRLETQATFVQSLTDTLEGGLGQLVDANLAEESAKLQALQTKQQLGIQSLSIANQQPAAILSLFR